MSNIGGTSQFLWFNGQIQIGNKTVFFSAFSERNFNFVGQLFKTVGAVKPWKKLQEEFGLANKLKLKWIQQIYSIPKQWIEQIFIDSGNCHIPCLNKLDSKELYSIQLFANFHQPNSQAYFGKVFAGHVFDWNKIYILTRIVTIDSTIQILQ